MAQPKGLGKVWCTVECQLSNTLGPRGVRITEMFGQLNTIENVL